MTNTLTRAGLSRAAEILRAGADGIALLRTVMAVECRGSGFDRRGRVLILYEPHIAWREAGEPDRTRLSARGLAYPKWGQRPYPKDSYPAFTAAADINREIACRACSWGLGQLLGTNHKAAGYPSAVAMASAFAGGEDEQAAAMARFIVANPAMHRALLAHDWAGFASRYNGPGYAKNAYHTKLAAANARFSRDPWAGFGGPATGRTQVDTSRAANNAAATGIAGAVAAPAATVAVQSTTQPPPPPDTPPAAPSIWPAVTLGLVFALVAGVLIFKAIKSRPFERAPQEG
ncbi:MAG: N-acetylmuramidase family protein [Proteobacteria bacterium]|nr:N-acetylmuramidase family protein [Pseudomonadota bacterium]